MNDEQKVELLNSLFPALGAGSVFFAGILLGCGIEGYFFLALFLLVCGVILVSARAEIDEGSE